MLFFENLLISHNMIYISNLTICIEVENYFIEVMQKISHSHDISFTKRTLNSRKLWWEVTEPSPPPTHTHTHTIESKEKEKQAL